MALAAGDLFKVHKYTAYENYLRVEHADHLVELLSAMSFMNQVSCPSVQHSSCVLYEPGQLPVCAAFKLCPS